MERTVLSSSDKLTRRGFLTPDNGTWTSPELPTETSNIASISEVARTVMNEVHRALWAAEDARNTTEQTAHKCRYVKERYLTVSAHLTKARKEVTDGR